MSKKILYITLVSILALAVIAGIFDYPKYFNQGISYLNQKFEEKELGFKIPEMPPKPFKLGLDLQGGTHLIYEADLSKIEPQNHDSAMRGLRDVIERRVNLFGVKEPVVQVQKKGPDYRLIVELAGVKKPSEAIKMIGQTPYLEFREQKPNYKEILKYNKKVIKGQKKGPQKDPFEPTSLTGRYLKGAELKFDPTTNQPYVGLQFDKKGTKIFKKLTEENVGRILAIYIDGVPISAPKVREKITGGKAQITGEFSVKEAKSLARNLNAGALPVPINLISQQTVGASLGEMSLEKSLRAAMIGFLAVILFMIIIYRLPGLLASISLIIYGTLVLALFKLIPVTLTLAGIAGFILSVGMAIDANILIFSRMREELNQKKSLGVSVREGFSRAWPSIRDGNLTTLIVAAILFGFGSSFVKGFAFTLGLGILVSLFSAIFVTRNFLRCFVGTRLEKWRRLWK